MHQIRAHSGEIIILTGGSKGKSMGNKEESLVAVCVRYICERVPLGYNSASENL